jgi:hypothetical protein
MAHPQLFRQGSRHHRLDHSFFLHPEGCSEEGITGVGQEVGVDGVRALRIEAAVLKTVAADGGNGQGRSGQGRSGQERSGQERSGQERSGQERSGQERSGQERSGQERSGQERSGQGRSGQGRSGQERDLGTFLLCCFNATALLYFTPCQDNPA